MTVRPVFVWVGLAGAMCWGVVYALWAWGLLALTIALIALAVLFVALMRLDRVMSAPSYNRAYAHQLAHMAIGAAVVAGIAALFL